MGRHSREGSCPALAQELSQMFATDQQVRNRIVAEEERAARSREMQAVDAMHTARMKAIVAAYGWPGRSLVGGHRAMAAWLLVQHADHDVVFQRECLRLLERAVQQGEASREHLAYLTDRVLVNEGKPQIYGTQFGPDGPRPIEDEADLGTRRLRMGLPPFEQYKQKMLQLEAQQTTGSEQQPLFRPLRRDNGETSSG